MTSMRQPAASLPASGRTLPPYLSIAMPPDSRSFVPSGEQLNQLLVAVGKDADRQAFAALFKHFAPRLKSYLVRSGSSDAQAEEFAQEAMVNVWRKAASFDPEQAAASTWIYTVARNLRVDHYRRLGHRMEQVGLAPEEGAMTEEADPAPTPEAQVFGQECERGVRAALATLPAEQQRVLQLSFFEDHPHARIAVELGIPLGTVKSRVRLALSQLRRKLNGLEP
ncbi:MAG: sigma-70 family RNA polymerase sigma factor [Proteobacteria bacterium]|nr:sigma-70 family RNA polymerase sigma factor [Pseudomonadota bacterium]